VAHLSSGEARRGAAVVLQTTAVPMVVVGAPGVLGIVGFVELRRRRTPVKFRRGGV
jgi:hypothetical protein